MIQTSLGGPINKHGYLRKNYPIIQNYQNYHVLDPWTLLQQAKVSWLNLKLDSWGVGSDTNIESHKLH